MVKYTHEEVTNIYKQRGYELVSKYINVKHISTIKDKDGYLYNISLDRFNHTKSLRRFSKSNPYTIQNIKLWMKTNAKGYELISTEYKDSRSELLFKCPKGHEFSIPWREFYQGNRCGVCHGKQITIDNCIATTNSWVMLYLKNKKDGYSHVHSSYDKVDVICPNCGKETKIEVIKLCRNKSIGCECDDGISYNEKFIISLLNQLNVKYIREYIPKWGNNKRYDFYIPNYNVIIECNGGQHYKESGFKSYGGRTLQEEQKNDQYKKELALQNGIKNYIVLDCRVSELKQIKKSIINSELNKLFNLDNINWLECESNALKNKIKEVCNYWNNKKYEETTSDLSKVFNLSSVTISNYLKKGNELGWCNYNPKEEMIKNNKIQAMKNVKSLSKPVEIFKDGKSLGVFCNAKDLEDKSEKLFGVKLLYDGINRVCRGKKLKYKNFTFKYV